MNSQYESHEDHAARDLRARAHDRLRERNIDPADLTTYDVQSLIEELQVHQIELEIQNDELRTAQSEIVEARDRYRRLYDHAPVGYFSIQGDRIIEPNRAACSIFGEAREHLANSRLRDFIAPESIETYQAHQKTARSSGKTESCEVALHDLRGNRWHVRIESNAADDASPEDLHCAILDISARKAAEREIERAHAELYHHERELRTILDTTPIGIVTVDEKGIMKRINPATVKKFGYYSAEDLVQRSFSLLISEAYAEEYEQYFSRIAGESESEVPDEPNWRSGVTTMARREITGKRRDGEPFPLEVSIAKADRALLVITLRDLSETKRLEWDVLLAAEEERFRLSREMHDTISQEIAGIAMSAYALAGNEGSPKHEELRRLYHQLQDTIRRLRAVIHDRAPAELGHDNLVDALAALATETDNNTRIDCYCHARQPFTHLDTDVAIQLLLIAREAVYNAVKHSVARRIDIYLEGRDDALRLSVQDDGVGMATAQDETDSHPESSHHMSGGIGLRIMRYRAHLIGATLDVHSEPDVGTRIDCTFAFPAPKVSP